MLWINFAGFRLQVFWAEIGIGSLPFSRSFSAENGQFFGKLAERLGFRFTTCKQCDFRAYPSIFKSNMVLEPDLEMASQKR